MNLRALKLVGLVFAVVMTASCTSGVEARPTPPVTRLDIAVAQPQVQRMTGQSRFQPAACAMGVMWQDVFYAVMDGSKQGVPKNPRPDVEIDGVVIPGCNDTGDANEPDTPIRAWSIKGIDPEIAILVKL